MRSKLIAAAVRTFFRQLLKGYRFVPRVVITDKLASSGAAMREILPSVEHRQHRSLNNRAEHCHQREHPHFYIFWSFTKRTRTTPASVRAFRCREIVAWASGNCRTTSPHEVSPRLAIVCRS